MASGHSPTGALHGRILTSGDPRSGAGLRGERHPDRLGGRAQRADSRPWPQSAGGAGEGWFSRGGGRARGSPAAENGRGAWGGKGENSGGAGLFKKKKKKST